jgi:type I restriction enzyme S subunit
MWGEVPDGWMELKFQQVFRVKNDKSKQIKKSDYKESGSHPIVDQSSKEIAGFADGDPNEEFPVIIFGDHTRCVKWIDFPYF